MLDNASSNKNWRYLTNSTVHKQCDSSKYGEFHISSIEHTSKHRTLWLLLSSCETHLSRFIKWSEFVGMLTHLLTENFLCHFDVDFVHLVFLDIDCQMQMDVLYYLDLLNSYYFFKTVRLQVNHSSHAV